MLASPQVNSDLTQVTQLTELGIALLENKFIELPSILALSTCGILTNRVQLLAEKNKLLDCEQCPESSWAYEDPLFCVVQEDLQKTLSDLLGIQLVTSFNSVRLYPKGETLSRHLDREAAEYVLSVTLDYQGEQCWPLCLAQNVDDNIGYQAKLNIGDAVLMRGHDVYHWREPLENDWQIQAFFFFVDANGPHQAHAGDVINKYKPR